MDNPLPKRLLRHAFIVGVVLAVLGYGLGQAFLFAHRFYAGDSYNVENERVLWQTPLLMAAIGVLISMGMDVFANAFRKPAPITAQVPPPSGNG
jgi:high-affinity Fe2+/Pb2+ permease